MASILELSRQKLQIKRELLRRIGYTNGLHNIYRFARVVEYLYPIIPSTTAMLQSIISKEEKIYGKKYVRGIIDIALSLRLIDKIGQKLSLSDRGYALHSIEKEYMQEKYRRSFLLMSVLEADGEYFLNLLDMIGQGDSKTIKLGNRLIDRMFRIIELKDQWADIYIKSSIAKDIVRGHLFESKRVLEKAIDPSQKILTKSRSTRVENQLSAGKRIERFLEHTVEPRLGWLVDLCCAKKDNNGHIAITEQGKRILEFFKTKNCWQDRVYLLPFSDWLARILKIENLPDAKDLFWRAVATGIAGKAEQFIFEDRELLTFIKEIYPHIKIYGFNEAHISSVFHVLSCIKSLEGRYILEDQFDDNIASLVKSFPREIFRLSKRRGPGGYVALKQKYKKGKNHLWKIL